MGNAVKFTERGEVAVGVSLESEDDKTATLRFAVRDTGIGIAEDKLEALFQPFTQADASTTRRFGGTGLGLSISKSLVERFHGQIGATSTPGEGSTFWFTALFEKQAAAIGGDDGGARPAFEGPVPTSIEGVRILAVDDNATNRKVDGRYARFLGGPSHRDRRSRPRGRGRGAPSRSARRRPLSHRNSWTCRCPG